jgi:hypothetical protein
MYDRRVGHRDTRPTNALFTGSHAHVTGYATIDGLETGNDNLAKMDLNRSSLGPRAALRTSPLLEKVLLHGCGDEQYKHTQTRPQ